MRDSLNWIARHLSGGRLAGADLGDRHLPRAGRVGRPGTDGGFRSRFDAGTYAGSVVEEWLALGQSMIRVVAPSHSDPVAMLLGEQGYGVTVLNGDGLSGEVRVTFGVVPRKKVWTVTRLIYEANPQAFVTVEQTSTVNLAERHGGDVQK